MADVLVPGTDRRVLISGGYGGLPPQAPPPPPAAAAAESLLGRLDQIDLRLRQLEEQQQHSRRSHADDDGASARRRAPGAPQHQHTRSLPAALQHAQVRGSLMDRLNLLESRIRQLSCELDLDVGKAARQLGLGTASSVPPVEDPATWSSDSAPMAVVDPAPPAVRSGRDVQSKSAAAAGTGGWSAVEILQRGARQFHRGNKPNPPNNKVKNLEESKCACQKEKRKAEPNKTSRRWFMVGC